MIDVRIPLYLIVANTESSCSPIQGCQISYIPYICHFFTSIVNTGNCLSGLHVRGCLHDTGDDFCAGASSLQFPLMALFVPFLFMALFT